MAPKEIDCGGMDLTMELLHHLVNENAKRNIVFSPLSVQMCVGLAFSGASGDTAAEIAEGMKFSSNSYKDVANYFNSIQSKYNGNLLQIANKAYVMQGTIVKDAFKKVLRKSYHAEVESTDFSNSESVTQEINNWVKKQTAGKIEQLIPQGTLNSNTRLLLLNAIHFKGIWKKQFKVKSTVEGSFKTSLTQSVKCSFMNTEEKFMYGFIEHLNCSALQMPYNDSDLSMLILLPNEIEGWKALIDNPKSVDLFHILNEMNTTKVEVRLPKFKNELSIELSSTLKNLGIRKMFEANADFSNMLEDSVNIYVSKVLHKACIEVNEEGTEAAAATGMVMLQCSLGRTATFIADHPFFYVIWNGKNILFAGLFMGIE